MKNELTNNYEIVGEIVRMLHIYSSATQMSLEVARHAASLLRAGLDRHISLRLVAAAGASQLGFLEQLGRTGNHCSITLDSV
jgi:6-phosphogluconolactonase/glucosamine-6-phosphate isomerase/deaminase